MHPRATPLHRAFTASLLVLLGACAAAQRNERFGAPLSEPSKPVVALEELLAAPERYDGAELVLTGSVREVCLRKGCWMTMGTDERELRVTFQDYGFFVPTNCAGATLRAEGTFRVGETSAELTRHYLHDVGKVEEAKLVTQPVKTFTFVATGVELAR
jgi:hypothetical protein